MIAQEESPMLMMMGAHPMLAESTKALNQAQIDGLRASRMQNRFCIKLWVYKKTWFYAQKFWLEWPVPFCPLSNRFKKFSIHKRVGLFRIFRVREQQRWMFLKGNYPYPLPTPQFWGKKIPKTRIDWALRPSIGLVGIGSHQGLSLLLGHLCCAPPSW